MQDEKRYAWNPFQLSGEHASALYPLSRRIQRTNAVFAPDFEVVERDSGYVIQADVPGVRADDIDVILHDQYLTVTGKRLAARRATEERCITDERRYGSFSRTFNLPPDASATDVAADLEGGVLTIQVPRQPRTRMRRASLRERVRHAWQRRA